MPSFFAKHWFLLLLTISLLIALVLPTHLKAFTDYWEPARTVAVSLFLMAWTMPTRPLLAEARRPNAALWAVFLSYGLVPIGAWLLGMLTPSEDVRIGLILISASPCTLATAILWTRMAGGHEATALLTVLGTTSTSFLVTTAWLYILIGTSMPDTVEINFLDVMLRLLLSLVLPVVLGQMLRRLPRGREIAERHKVALGALAQLLVLAIILKAAVTVGLRLAAESAWNVPELVVSSIVLAMVLHLSALYGGLWSSRWLGFDRGRQIAVAFSASQKTLQVALILYDQYFSAFPFAIMPLLIYHVGQLMLDTVIARRLRAGAPPEDETEPPRLE